MRAPLVNTMFGFETWRIPFNQADKSFGTPEKLYDGATNGTGVPLEFYGNETELFVSHALPGVVKRYELSKLPDLVSSGPDIVADAGSHHMIFYSTRSGRKVIAVQNNLLNLGNAADNDPTDRCRIRSGAQKQPARRRSQYYASECIYATRPDHGATTVTRKLRRLSYRSTSFLPQPGAVACLHHQWWCTNPDPNNPSIF